MTWLLFQPSKDRPKSALEALEAQTLIEADLKFKTHVMNDN